MLGIDVKDCTNADGVLDVQAACKRADLDWTVARRKLYMRDTREQITPERELDEYYAITRGSEAGAPVFQIASNKYEPHQNEDIVSFFAEYANAAGSQLESLGSLNNGALVFGQAPLPNGSFEVSPGDVVKGFLSITTSHDGSLSTRANYSSTRIVCQNTFRMVTRDRSQVNFAMKHNRKFDSAMRERAARALKLAVESNQSFAERARALARVPVDEIARLEFITRLTNPNLLADVVSVSSPVVSDGASALDAILGANEADTRVKQAHELTRADLTRTGSAILAAIINGDGATDDAWGLFNGLTYWTDHVAGRTKNGNRDAALASAYFGPNAQLKENALTILETMADIRRA